MCVRDAQLLEDHRRMNLLRQACKVQAEMTIWYDAATVAEAHVQQELRCLHMIVEDGKVLDRSQTAEEMGT